VSVRVILHTLLMIISVPFMTTMGKCIFQTFFDTRNVFLCNLIHVYEVIIFFDENIVFREITLKSFRGLRGHDRMVVGFTATYIRGGSRGGGGGAHPARAPPKIGKNTIFFTRNTPKMFTPPSARRNFLKCAPPLT
jgi:hypothetical protein